VPTGITERAWKTQSFFFFFFFFSCLVRKLIKKGMGGEDVFYGNDDHREMNDSMYKEDVIESMRREQESKDLKKRREKNCCYSYFLSCFNFFTLLRAFINF